MTQRTEEQRNELARAWRESGEPIATFAARHQIGRSTLYEWSRRLVSKAEQPIQRAAFTEVAVVEQRTASPAGRESGLELIVGDITIRVPALVDRQALSTVLELVRQC